MNETPSLIRSSRTFYLRGQVLCVQTDEIGDVQGYWGHSCYIFICPQCGEEWARVHRPDRQDLSNPSAMPSWFVESRYCDKHMDRMWYDAAPGMFFNCLKYPEIHRHAPREVLVHDFLKHMELVEALGVKAKRSDGTVLSPSTV